MLNFGIPLFTTGNPVGEHQTGQQEETMDISERALSTPGGTSPCSGDFLSPRTPDYNRANRSYRSSYPPSNHELQDYAEAMKKSLENETSPQQSSGSNSHESTDNHPRPRRSSLRQPGTCRRNSTSVKRVRFDTEDRVYEPFNRPHSQMIEQILSLMRLDPRSILYRSIPRRALHAVSNDSIAAAHEYSEPVSPMRDVPPSTSFGQPDIGDRRCSCEDPEYRSEVRSTLRSPSCLGAAPPLRSPLPVEMQSSSVRVPSVSEARLPLRLTYEALTEHDHQLELQSPDSATERRQKRYSSSHYETRSQRQAMTRADSCFRPRANTIPHPSQLNRSSSESEETVVTPEMTWAPAAIMLAKPPTQASLLIDENEPIPVPPKEDGRLRRKDARRLPAVPRRNKVLRSIARIFE